MRPARLRREIESVVPGAPCIVFTGKQQPNGYGRVCIDGKYRRAHVYACEFHVGANPGGMDTAHSCGNRMCINPAHLRWATHAENEADKIVHGLTNRGERSGSARLTEQDVREIRQASNSQTEIAREYGVHIMTINDIIHNRTWQHV